jgi:hypothetical protein
MKTDSPLRRLDRQGQLLVVLGAVEWVLTPTLHLVLPRKGPDLLPQRLCFRALKIRAALVEL